MDKQKQQFLILGVLFVVLTFSLVSTFKTKKQKKKVKMPAKAARKTPEQKKADPKDKEPAVTLASSKEREEQRRRAEMDWGIDPIYHKIETDIYQSSRMKLKGVSIGADGNSFVLINDEIVTLGDIVMEHKVVEIQKDKVRLQKGTESFFLLLPEE
ncbi:MAG: hypothetical protein ABH872_03070 [Candidatus Omnitrophota bacterium]